MLTALKVQWHGLQRSPPGRRFQNRYAGARKKRAQTPVWHRVLRVGLGLALMVVGVVFAFIPGPAVLFFALAGALFATESRILARGMDGMELRLRAAWNGTKRRWHRFGWAGRIAVAVVGSGIGVGAALVAWHIFLG